MIHRLVQHQHFAANGSLYAAERVRPLVDVSSLLLSILLLTFSLFPPVSYCSYLLSLTLHLFLLLFYLTLPLLSLTTVVLFNIPSFSKRLILTVSYSLPLSLSSPDLLFLSKSLFSRSIRKIISILFSRSISPGLSFARSYKHTRSVHAYPPKSLYQR